MITVTKKRTTSTQRVVFPEAMIGNRVVELIADGRNTRALREIRGKIRSIINDEKTYYETRHAQIPKERFVDIDLVRHLIS